jgi:phosphate transport system substrate-binding protein
MLRQILLTGSLVASAATVASLLSAQSSATGQLVVAGHGPERVLIERLARAFEKANPGTAVRIRWDRTFKTVDMVKAGQAHVAVTGENDTELAASPIAWDGIAVIVNFSNPVKEVTAQQVTDLFTSTIKLWSELGGSATRVDLIQRPADRNIRAGFERSLGIAGQVPALAKVIRSDQKVLSTVGGSLAAVSYISLGAALDAVQYGTPVRILIVDGVEPGEPTVKNGRYKLRRPVLLTSKKADPLTAAFVEFALSPRGQKIVDELFIPSSP